MSAQDKIERSLKQIHVLFSEGPIISGNPDKVVVDKKEVFAILEQLNLAIYEMMDQYEATSQARELAQRRSEKKGEELLERISRQADDVYAASLIYTDNALDQVQELLQKVMETSQRTWKQLGRELEREKSRVKKDQRELKDQLKDFKDSNKYLTIIENYNREREKKEQKKEGKEPKKRIQNEAKHYTLNEMPEIRVNPAYFERRRQKAEQNKAEHLLQARGAEANGAGVMAKASAEVMSAGKLLLDRSGSKIAEMAIQGNHMGSTKTLQHLHDYRGSDPEALALTRRLLAAEEAGAEELKVFL